MVILVALYMKSICSSMDQLSKSKVLEVHEKSDLVPAPVQEEKNDCVPQSDYDDAIVVYNVLD